MVCGGRWASSVGVPPLASCMLPACDGIYPVTRFTSVVLPAPLGPIKPKMVPSSISRDTSSTACTPPNDRLTLVSCSNALTRPPARPPARRDDGEATPADDALRPEDDDEDQNDAVDDVAIGGKLAHDLRQRGEEDRADDRADHVCRPADHGEGQDLDGARDAVLGRVDEEVDMGLECPRIAGDEGADDEGDHLVGGHVDTVAGSGQLVLADRGPGLAEPGVC